MAAQEEGVPAHLMQLYVAWREAELEDLELLCTVLDTNALEPRLDADTGERKLGAESPSGETKFHLIMLSPAGEAEEMEIVKKKLFRLRNCTLAAATRELHRARDIQQSSAVQE
jgi:hypothetical protein